MAGVTRIISEPP